MQTQHDMDESQALLLKLYTYIKNYNGINKK